ncbi:SusD-like starch-binding protein associating with outer membrane [Gelidibacter algens]|uniref:SusD-like starch-binding protein associating with outer membrane n=2 Tax=Gelidibacter algens TaxID=49280 RepID=A0A1A7R3Y5_9FLAO|nr:RagB/SusD family nutrient uptake outer membrane protein [Gelidibacter algens]OBX26223.1 glycan metabolism protein RagB [Gelidibacter algens]RAJ22451.1 SusD-like starch-binding protein associating with outer membrane [Gelidibacter algens]
MKNIIKLTLATCLIVSVNSCSDILDNSGVAGDSQPTQFLTADQLEKASETNLGIPAAFVGGIYSQMIQTGSGGSTSQTDFGHKSYDLFSDMLSGDMALSVSTYGWYRADITEFQAPLDYTRGSNRQVWRYYYRIVRSANTVIQNLGGNDAVPELVSNKYAMGQAKAMRAHSYFYLTQFFQKEYNASEAILPLYTEPTGGNLPKSTASEIYDLMESDLTSAISLLEGFNRSAKNEVNQDVAKAILAYVLGAKGGRDTEVATLTQDVINSGAYSMLSSDELTTTGFADASNPSWMWGIDVVENNGLGLVSWWGQLDAYSYSYGWAGDYKVIDKTLWDAIPADDARKAQFLNNPASGRNLQPLKKFFASGTIGGTSITVTADYVYMRIEEMYLLNAEANAKAGNDGAAKISLKALLANRIPNTAYVDGLAGQALKDQIYLQTRIELWGEGKSYLAMKRNKATTVRGTNHLSFVGDPIPYNDERMQFEIPLDEIQNNPFITDQNQ